MNLVGISGTNGAGKDSIGEYLAAHHGWLFISVTEILREELKKQKKPLERHHLRELSADWRRIYGHGVLIDKAVAIYEAQQDKYHGLVVSSIRNPGEAQEIHRLSGKLIWVDADPHLRYMRISSRARSSEDNKTFEEFLTEEQHEMSHSGDEATLSMETVKTKADVFIENNGSELNKFYKKIDQALGL